MRFLALALLAALTGLDSGFCWAQPAEEPPELTSELSIFSAYATAGKGVRLNWTLDHQSPTITKFRIYRGYQEVGNFSVLCEVPAQHEADTVAYSIRDTIARPQVSYYYKLAAVGQRSESVFPVVISAVPLAAGQTPLRQLPDATILPSAKILLYVRTPGRVHLSVQSSPERVLVDETLRPGIYEFDPLSSGPLSLWLEHESGLKTSVTWPLP
jgi:hypothetical protein